MFHVLIYIDSFSCIANCVKLTFCDCDNVTLCHLNVRLPSQHFAVQRFHFLVDTISPGSVSLCSVLWWQSTTTDVHSCTKCHNRAATHNQENTQTRLPNPQQREHNGRENKGCFFFPVFDSGSTPPALLPASRAESCLYRAFPAATATITHAPSAWLALSHHSTPKPTATSHRQARSTHKHTYPNTRLPTINHYSGRLGGCF